MDMCALPYISFVSTQNKRTIPKSQKFYKIQYLKDGQVFNDNKIKIFSWVCFIESIN